MAKASYYLSRGDRPLLVSMPHTATALPTAIASRMTDSGRAVPDTDWHIHRLYEFAVALGCSTIRPHWSRYVVDLNRPADGQALYPGKDESELCPLTSFDREDLYRPGQAPNSREIGERVERYWQPYHQALATELQRLRRVHGYALLWDAHSIRSRVPRFFPGRLPDFNIGTADGRACPLAVAQAIEERIVHGGRYSSVVDGRFKGGYITRRYGSPEARVYALQLELSQATYMDERVPYRYRPRAASEVVLQLRDSLSTYIEVATAHLRDTRLG